MYLEIDNRGCSQRSVDCFSTVNEVASYLAAAHIKAQLPYPLESVTSSKSFSSENILEIRHSHHFQVFSNSGKHKFYMNRPWGHCEILKDVTFNP